MKENLNTGKNEKKWHTLTVDEMFSSIGSNMNGLTEGEAGKRLEKYGPNELKEGKKHLFSFYFSTSLKIF